MIVIILTCFEWLLLGARESASSSYKDRGAACEQARQAIAWGPESQEGPRIKIHANELHCQAVVVA